LATVLPNSRYEARLTRHRFKVFLKAERRGQKFL
jgi:hypothetical protein